MNRDRRYPRRAALARTGPALALIAILAVGAAGLGVAESVGHHSLDSKVAVGTLLFLVWALLSWCIWVE